MGKHEYKEIFILLHEKCGHRQISKKEQVLHLIEAGTLVQNSAKIGYNSMLLTQIGDSDIKCVLDKDDPDLKQIGGYALQLLAPIEDYERRIEIINDVERLHELTNIDVNDEVEVYYHGLMYPAIVRYTGDIRGKPSGIYFGVELHKNPGDGDTNGSFKGRVYFECEYGYQSGTFLDSSQIRLKRRHFSFNDSPSQYLSNVSSPRARRRQAEQLIPKESNYDQIVRPVSSSPRLQRFEHIDSSRSPRSDRIEGRGVLGLNRIREFANSNSHDSISQFSRNAPAKPPRRAAKARSARINDDTPVKLGEEVIWMDNDGQAQKAVVKWIGTIENELNWFVGVEFENAVGSGTGFYEGEQLFTTKNKHAGILAIDGLIKIKDFVGDGEAELGGNQVNAFENHLADVKHSEVVALPRKRERHGRWRGIQGNRNSCYLDAMLFSMFSFTNVFDELLYRHKRSNDIEEYEKVQEALRDKIVRPLRENYFVPAENTMQLRTLLDRLGSVGGLTCEEKDPEEFLESLLGQTLKADHLIHLSSGESSYMLQLISEANSVNLEAITVQELFEETISNEKITLTRVPPCLILQMPRSGKDFKMYKHVVPNLTLDISKCLKKSSSKLYLFAVLCIQTSHYVAFVRSRNERDAKWYFFDSMADHEENLNGDIPGGECIPSVELVPEDLDPWLARAAEVAKGIRSLAKGKKLDIAIPQVLTDRFTQDPYLCLYEERVQHVNVRSR